MANQFYMQNNFTHGELDPRLFSGTNLEYYYKSLKRARNVYVRPQGGIKRRHGTIYEKTLSAQPGEYKLGNFILDEDNRFIFIFQPLEIIIYKLNSNGSLGDSYTVVTPYSDEHIRDLDWAQNGNLMIIVHPGFPPKELSFNTDTSTWNSLISLPIKNPPAYDFAKNYYSYTFKIDDVVIKKGTTLRSSTAVFTDDYIGGIFIGLGSSTVEPIGFARITAVGSATPVATCTVDVIYPFDDSLKNATGTGVIGSECFLGQPAFVSTDDYDKGYPTSVTFYESRLVFGGTPLLPQTLFMSRIGSFNDFSQGDSSDDDAIVFTLSSSEYNKIKYLVSDKSLQIFCDEAEFSSMQYFAEPVTPQSASFRKQSAYGVSNMRPVVLDNQTFFVREGGKSIMSFVFQQDSNSYNSYNSSLFSAHLVKDPVAAAVLKGDAYEDADYMFMVNSDGTLLVYQSMSQQNISAYTLCATGEELVDLESIVPQSGKFKDIINIKETIYVVVERIIDGVSVQYLERLSYDVRTDCTIIQSYPHDTTVITGLSHLEGQLVSVTNGNTIYRVDNSISNGRVSSGQITLLDAGQDFNIGINVRILAETIPANIAGAARIYVPKKIVRLFIDYYDSIGIKVNDRYIPELDFGQHFFNTPLVPKTGIFTARGNEWEDRVTIQITQDQPLPFLIIGLGFEVTE